MCVDWKTIARRLSCLTGAIGVALLGNITVLATVTVTAPGWGGKKTDRVTLLGADDRRQLLITEIRTDGINVDLTRNVTLEAEPTGLVSLYDGLVAPMANGAGVITATTQSGETATIAFEVKGFSDVIGISFSKSIVPIFTRHGCNGGGCHGKASGQNGFKLSVFGFEPQDDYEFLLREARGRRVFPAAPERSLLILKASGQLPHAGGARIDAGTFDYNMLVKWMKQGMSNDNPTEPTVESIEVHPTDLVMKTDSQQQLAVLARLSDDSVRDVTHYAVYESNNSEYADADGSGLVKVSNQTGEIAVMVRYLDKATLFRASVPRGVPVADLPTERNLIDKHIFAKWKKVGMPPSRVATDSTYLRRVSLDIAGRLPTVDETTGFISDKSPGKREQLVRRLLTSEEYADYFANKWSAMLRNKRANGAQLRTTIAFYEWIKDSFFTNKPYDRFVREILVASGDVEQSPPTAWYKQVNTPQAQMEDAAQLFLGTRLQCAQCHHHPYEKWSQEDYFRFMAFFSRVGKESTGRPGEEVIFHRAGVALATNKKTNKKVKPAGLGSGEFKIAPAEDPRHRLVDWMRQDQAQLFSRTLVNRYWKHFFGRGLVDPEDDLRSTNPATHPALLAALADDFVESGYDLKNLVLLITGSTTYQLSSMPNEHNARDSHYFSRFQPKRLTAEVLYDSLNELLLAKSSFDGLPAGTRAVCLPDNSFNGSNYFLSVFGRPDSSSACECERTQEASLAQSLHLFNAKNIHKRLSHKDGRAAKLAADNGKDHAEKIIGLYYRAFARPPHKEEMSAALSYLNSEAANAKDGKPVDKTKERYEDILWALVNTKEFLFNH